MRELWVRILNYVALHIKLCHHYHHYLIDKNNNNKDFLKSVFNSHISLANDSISDQELTLCGYPMVQYLDHFYFPCALMISTNQTMCSTFFCLPMKLACCMLIKTYTNSKTNLTLNLEIFMTGWRPINYHLTLRNQAL